MSERLLTDALADVLRPVVAELVALEVERQLAERDGDVEAAPFRPSPSMPASIARPRRRSGRVSGAARCTRSVLRVGASTSSPLKTRE
jgi:hypothetical protein